jgi:hypothetical protein
MLENVKLVAELKVKFALLSDISIIGIERLLTIDRWGRKPKDKEKQARNRAAAIQGGTATTNHYH